MATARSEQTICSIVEYKTLKLKLDLLSLAIEKVFNGVAVIEDMLLVTDYEGLNIQTYNRHDGKLMSTSDRLESSPRDVCIISKTLVAVCLEASKIVIMSLESMGEVKRVKTLNLRKRFDYCHSVAKWKSDKLIISGWKMDGQTFRWVVVSVTDGRIDSTHDICKRVQGVTCLAIKDNTLYFSCYAYVKTNTDGVYAFDILKPRKPKFLYQHKELENPRIMFADRDYVYVFYWKSKTIHQVTDCGQLVTMHSVSSDLYGLFYDDQHGVLYTTIYRSDQITVYKIEYPHQPGVPIEISKMGDRSIQLFQEALRNGMETVYNIRVIVVGEGKVGKTTLVRRLLGDEVNMLEKCSTESTDAYVNCCDVSLSTHEWSRRPEEPDYHLQRLVKLINENYLAGGKVDVSELDASSNQKDRTDDIPMSNAADDSQNTEVLYRRSQELYYGQQRLVKLLNENYLAGRKVADSELDASSNQKDRTDDNPMSNATDDSQNTEVLYRRAQEQNIGQNNSPTFSLQKESATPIVQSEDTELETNTVSGSEFEVNAAIDNDKNDPLREMIKLLHHIPDKAKQDLTKYARITMLDFPGQCAYYTIGQMLLSRHAIYLLVLNSSVNANEIVEDEYYFNAQGTLMGTTHDFVEIWMNYIHSCAPPNKEPLNTEKSQTSSYGVIPPPVILVGTHIDQLPQNRHGFVGKVVRGIHQFVSPLLAHRMYCRKHGHTYVEDIRSYLKDKPTRVHLVDKKFAIDNSVVDSELEELKKKIVEVASQQPYWGEQIPTRWFLLEQQLMRLKDGGVKVLPRIIVEHLNKKGTDQITKSEEMDLFLKYLHETGKIIYFSIEVLRDNIVLDTNWLTDALNSLINAHIILPSNPVASADHNITQKWSDFNEKGILTFELLDAIWTKETHPELHAHKIHILNLMEQLNIIAKPRSFNEQGVKVDDYFLTPCMLRHESPTEVISPEQDDSRVTTTEMRIVFTGNYLPTHIFHRLLAACIARWPVANNEISDNLIFCGCCVFDLDLFHRLIVYIESHVVHAKVTGLVIDEIKTPDANMCNRVRRFIDLNLSKITSCLGQNLQYDMQASVQIWLADEEHDPATPLTCERMNHSRLCVALVTVCGNVMMDVLHTYVPSPHTDIYQAILANKVKLTSGRPLLNSYQIQLVFPDSQGKTIGNVNQFDISLLYILIRNISSVPHPLTGWGIDPSDNPRDISLGASVERIRSYKNDIIDRSIDGEIKQQDFHDYWNKLDAVLDDIEHALGRQGYRAQLEKQKTQVISVFEAC